MAWVKIDDQFSDHPKVLEVGPLAECLFVRGLTYASRYLTDGFVPASHLRRMGDLDAFTEAGKLVAAGLWAESENGYQIHDYLDYQPSAEKVKAEREAARIRMETARAAKQSGNKPRRSPEVRPNNPRSSDNPDPTRVNTEVPNGTSDDNAPNGAQKADAQPFSLLEALCEVLGQDTSVLTNRERGKQLAVAKRLIEEGATPQDVTGISRWLMSQSWRTTGVDLFTVEKHIGEWKLAGKPDAAVPGSLTRLNGGLAANDPSINPQTGKPYAYNHPKNPRSMVG